MDEKVVVNVPLLRKAVEWAEAEAAKPFELCEWYQGEWVTDPKYATRYSNDEETGETLAVRKSPDCGTCYCVAGHVGAMLDERYATSTYAVFDGEEQHVETFATHALGLTRGEAERLFSGNNSIEDVRRIAEEIAGEKL